MPDSAAALTAYLHEHIPLSRAMDVRVVACDARHAVVAAPLAPNLNHRGTAFGGSGASLALLAGWTLLHARLGAAGVTARLVIKETAMRYTRPIAAEFTARCDLPNEAAWERFLEGAQRKGAGRIKLAVVVTSEGAVAATFTGEYVALTGAA